MKKFLIVWEIVTERGYQQFKALVVKKDKDKVFSALKSKNPYRIKVREATDRDTTLVFAISKGNALVWESGDRSQRLVSVFDLVKADLALTEIHCFEECVLGDNSQASSSENFFQRREILRFRPRPPSPSG